MSNVILSAHAVCKSFSGNKAVNNVSLDIMRGEITGLIGANGAGKTTFFNCLTGYYHATSGRIEFEGKRIEKLAAHKICHLGMARTFQIAKPFGDLTVLQNAAIGAYNKENSKAAAFDNARSSLNFVGLGDKAEQFASGLNTGDQRRLELARALSTKPKLLLLDEVMAGLTPSESAEMITLIRNINKSGVTILMIEHIMPAIMSLSDVLYVLEQGSLIASGTPDEVSINPKVIQSYLGGTINA